MHDYESLKTERNRLKAILDKNKNIAHHDTYKAVRKQYDECYGKIKAIFHK